MKLRELEKIVFKHLEESGEIRAGIKSLEMAYTTLSGRLWTILVLSLTTLMAVCGFLLKVTLWK